MNEAAVSMLIQGFLWTDASASVELIRRDEIPESLGSLQNWPDHFTLLHPRHRSLCALCPCLGLDLAGLHS